MGAVVGVGGVVLRVFKRVVVLSPLSLSVLLMSVWVLVLRRFDTVRVQTPHE